VHREGPKALPGSVNDEPLVLRLGSLLLVGPHNQRILSGKGPPVKAAGVPPEAARRQESRRPLGLEIGVRKPQAPEAIALVILAVMVLFAFYGVNRYLSSCGRTLYIDRAHHVLDCP
jgi:hypothetical protein